MIRYLILILAPAAAMADVPLKPTLTQYSKLWTDSPFTSKPVIEREVREVESPLDDFALSGISELKDGYYVVLINKKKPDERKIIRSGDDSGFKVLDVQWGEETWKDTVAKIQSGAHTKEIGFDDQVLAVKTAPAQQKPPQAQPGRPVIPGLNQPSQPGARQPRPRVVRPPTPRPNTNNK
jgi:hypothetical protein